MSIRPRREPEGMQPSRTVVRLNLNLPPEVAQTLKALCTQKSMSITDGVRRAIALWHLMESEHAQGNRIAVIEPGADGDRVREIILV